MSSRQQQSRELDALLGHIRKNPDGLALEHLTSEFERQLTQRTLLRRLKALIERGDIHKAGKRRSARYFATADADKPRAQEPRAKEPTARQSDLFVPPSKSATDVMRRVSRPLTQRKPVGYNRAFLEDYRPNQSSYLSKAEKRHLAELGVTAMPAGPAGTYAHHILERLLIDLSWNSSRLEGNTYSLLDTERLIEFGEHAEGKASMEAQMILNHKAAIEFLVQAAGEIAFDRRTILNLHALLAQDLLPNPSAVGRLRTKAVGIGGSVYLPLANADLIDEAFSQILATAAAIKDPFEQALFAMVQLPYLQPFDDVNKRVSRLAANIPLIRNNLSPLSFVDVSDQTYVLGMLGVYELNRVELIKDVFLWAYERSAHRYAAIRQTVGAPDPFRITYRSKLKTVIADVVRGGKTKQQAARYIDQWATQHINASDRPRFVEIAETELVSMHEGSFARYQLRPSEFDAWQSVWNIAPSKPKKRSS